MRKISFSEATREAMAEEMEKYPEVFVMGEDLARQGGIFGQFKGLPEQFPGRVMDTPISETFIIGGGVGAALAGARPVVDMHFADFIGVCMDEVFNQMAKARYMFGGQATRRHGRRRCCPALPVRGVLVHPHPRHQGRGSLQPL